jgi:LemA protein
VDKASLQRERNLGDEELAEVIRRAARLQREERDARHAAIDPREVAGELDIAPEYVDRALAELAAERQEVAARAARRRDATRRALRIALPLALLLGAVIVTMAYSRGNALVAASEARLTAQSRLDAALARQAELVPQLVALSGGDPRRLQARAREVLATTDAEARQQAAAAFEAALAETLATLPEPGDAPAEQRRLSLQHEVTGTRNRITVERARYEQALGAELRAHAGALSGLARALGWGGPGARGP